MKTKAVTKATVNYKKVNVALKLFLLKLTQVGFSQLPQSSTQPR